MGGRCSCFSGISRPTSPPRGGLSLTAIPPDLIQGRLLPAAQGAALAALACTSRDLLELVDRSPELWQALALEHLGTALCAVHQTVAPPPQDDAAAGRWWRELLQAACTCSSLCWERVASQRLLGPSSLRSAASQAARNLLRCCAHTSVAIGQVVLLIGGQRMGGGGHPVSGVVVVNCRLLQVFPAELAPDSERPEPRIRHASCAIAPGEGSDLPRVLVLGGVVDHWEPTMHGSREALILELLDPHGFCVRWHRQPCQGEAPSGEAPLFHHVLCSTNAGRRVLAWGGDTMDFDNRDGQERARTDCVSRESLIFELDVRTWHWTRVQTHGIGPGHRSLAAAVVHRNRMVVLGGSSDPKPPRAFSFGELAPMTPYALDLRTWTWQHPEPIEGGTEDPEPRTRFAIELRGDWLLGHGGRGSFSEYLDDLFCLNLQTLRWKEIRVGGGEDVQYADVFGSCMCGGIVFGGMSHGGNVPKADALIYSSVLEIAARPDQTTAALMDAQADDGVEQQEVGEPLASGQRILLRGLIARPDLNGLSGELVDFLEERGRWSVRMMGGRGDVTMLLRPDNIRLVQQ